MRSSGATTSVRRWTRRRGRGPPHVEVEAAPEGGRRALEANLPLDEAVAWFASGHTGRRFHRQEE